MKSLQRAFLVAMTLWFSGPAHGSEDITLTSLDGSIELSGELLSYDGEFFRIDTVFGVLTVDGAGVTCAGAACPDMNAFMAELMISGARITGARLMPALLEGFAEARGLQFVRQDEDDTHFLYLLTDPATDAPVARIRFRISTSAEGFADLVSEQADIAMSFREVSDAEALRAMEAGLGDLRAGSRSRLVALDGLVPVVSPANPVQAIAPLDLARALSGEIVDWADLGGPEGPITLHMPERSHALSEGFRARVMAPAALVPSAGVIRHADLGSLAAAVAADPRALGLSAASRTGPARALPLTGSCGQFAEATILSLKAEDYPLTTPHFLYTPARRLPAIARAFLEFASSDAGQEIVARAGYVDQLPEQVPLAVQGDRLTRAILAAGPEIGVRDLRRAVSALSGGDRLSVTFRFEDGSAELDAPSQANVGFLAGMIGRGRFPDREILFAGFSDGLGDAGANLDLSRRRAEAVRDAVAAAIGDGGASGSRLAAEGFGEVMPMGCDEDDWGRRMNRRVEVWLR